MRFGLIAAGMDALEPVEVARDADWTGYSTVGLNDHFKPHREHRRRRRSGI
jgi:hypothetical protein